MTDTAEICQKSSQINIKRGCRQGDPLSPYLFLLVVEILSLIIENDTSIKGITIGSQTYKLTQFADDTTILLDGNTSSLGAALNILEVFGSLSGLIVNAEKTKMVWIGSKRFSKDQLNVPAKLKWGNSNFTLLGIEFSTNMQDIPNINYSKPMTSANQVLSSWKYRSLTPFGKITVLKTLVLSKFNHLFASIISPQNFWNELNEMVFRHLWDGKPEKINQKRVCQDYLHGGMRMVDIFNFEKSLKLSWLKQLNIDNKKPWLLLLQESIHSFQKLYTLGPEWSLSFIPNLNPFWQTIFKYWVEFCRNNHAYSFEDILQSSIWYNKEMATENLFYPTWYKRGIHIVGDLVDENYKILSFENLKVKYNLNANILNYYTIRRLLTKFIPKANQSVYSTVRRPHIPFHISPLINAERGNKVFYNILTSPSLDQMKDKHEVKWSFVFKYRLSENIWRNIYKSCFKAISDNFFIWFQYRTIYRILGTNGYLKN